MPVVSGKALGRKRPLFADWSWPLPPPPSEGDDALTLRQVIGRIVQDQIQAFRLRQADNQLLRALTSREIAEGAERGKILSGGSEVPLQEVEDDSAVAAALQAFEDGLYLVVIDEAEQKQLDQQVFLRDDSRVTFLRLTFLAGG